jgi:spore maturation protein CgeB
MTIIVFGLSITSCWGNGHATFWRAVCRALARRRHRVVFYEQDRAFYRAHRDLTAIEGHDIVLYEHWSDIQGRARADVASAESAIVTSYCPDARAASTLVAEAAAGVRMFYDMDTPVTLERLGAGDDVEYLPVAGLSPFDLVLSYAGGPALTALERTLGAKRAVAWYGCVEPSDYPMRRHEPPAGLSYLATYADDRTESFGDLFLASAMRLPDFRFIVGGPNYPGTNEWPPHVTYRPHVGQADHLDFYGAARFTLNITRGPMKRWGYCPSGRLFEAAACGTPIMTDDWPGLSDFFQPGSDVFVARSTDDVVTGLQMEPAAARTLAARARQRVLDTCTADVRAREFEGFVDLAARLRAEPRTAAARS